MAFSSGTYSLYSPGNPVVSGTTISSTAFNNTMNDIATALSTCLLKDGTQTVTANIPMAAFKFTGLGAGSAAGNSLRYEQLFTTGAVAWLGPTDDAGVATVASASTVNLETAASGYVQVTGAVTITAITLNNGAERTVEFSGALTLTNGASLILPGGANIVTAAGDTAIFRGEAASVVRCIQYTKASGAPVTLSPITNSLTGDVSLNNTGTFFDGPSIAQGTSGKWFVSGTVNLIDTAGGANLIAKLWDGTTVIASAQQASPALNQLVSIALSGFISAPAGNLRISVRDATSTSGKILFNNSGASNDSTITAIRIA